MLKVVMVLIQYLAQLPLLAVVAVVAIAVAKEDKTAVQAVVDRMVLEQDQEIHLRFLQAKEIAVAQAQAFLAVGVVAQPILAALEQHLRLLLVLVGLELQMQLLEFLIHGPVVVVEV